MPDTNADELTVDLPASGKQTEVEIEAPEDVSTDASSGEEHEHYSKSVQRRIDKLTRTAREAERQQEAALSFAKNMQSENSALKDRVQNLDEGYVAEYGDRIATQNESLTKDLETAIATNDTSSQVHLNKKLAQLAIEEERVKVAKLQQKAAYAQAQAQAQFEQTRQAQQAPIPVRADPKAEKWASKNSWFGEDEAMTFAAFGIHKKLVEEEGFDTESPEYYDTLDQRLQEAFPHKFNGVHTSSDGRRPQQAVASATRSSSSGRKTVRLSPSEVAIARKLGVPLNEYAKYKR